MYTKDSLCRTNAAEGVMKYSIIKSQQTRTTHIKTCVEVYADSLKML